MTATTLVIFLCGFALGVTATFLFIAWAEARRVKILAARRLAAAAGSSPDHEPMELDQ
jgi:hypothetical protein